MKNDQHIFHMDNKIISQIVRFLVKISALNNIRENSNYDREKARYRRSAEAAEQTKCLILRVAADMFCELGYERVSLRNISEKAGVSHSLIRHHFGSKEKIWQAVSDAMDEFMQGYMAQLVNEMPANTPSNQKIYLFMVRMLAFALVNPHPVQMIADAIRQGDDALLQYFLRSKDEFAAIFTDLFADYNVEYPEYQIDQWESKWQMLVFAHGAISLAPMMQETYQKTQTTATRC